jgi:hypothetical protein
MPRPNVIVENITSLTPNVRLFRRGRREGTVKPISVSFAGGQTGLLDTSQSRSEIWAEVLESLQRDNTPVYVEIDPRSKFITEVLLPRAVSIIGFTPIPTSQDLQVELSPSSAVHYIRHTNPDFGMLQEALKTAQSKHTRVWVTETDTHEIIDVRSLPKVPELVIFPKPAPKPDIGIRARCRWQPPRHCLTKWQPLPAPPPQPHHPASPFFTRMMAAGLAPTRCAA